MVVVSSFTTVTRFWDEWLYNQYKNWSYYIQHFTSSFYSITIAIYALIYNNDSWKLATIILFAHISLDRVLGYGLKITDSFSNTHLGLMGKID